MDSVILTFRSLRKMENPDIKTITCIKCGSSDVSTGDGLNWAKNLNVCKPCEYVWHNCGTVTCDNLIEDNRVLVCQNCYIRQTFDDYSKLSQAQRQLERIVGAHCPGCWSMESSSTEKGRYCEKCYLFWHLCPMKEGTILFRRGCQPVCEHCVPVMEKERMAERAARFKPVSDMSSIPKTCTMRCDACHSSTVSLCSCGWDCSHWFCHECSLFMHVCPNKKGKTIGVRRPDGDLTHIYCIECGDADWCHKLGRPPSKPGSKLGPNLKKPATPKPGSKLGPELKKPAAAKKTVSDKELVELFDKIISYVPPNDFKDPFAAPTVDEP